jgi:hypothetical protein
MDPRRLEDAVGKSSGRGKRERNPRKIKECWKWEETTKRKPRDLNSFAMTSGARIDAVRSAHSWMVGRTVDMAGRSDQQKDGGLRERDTIYIYYVRNVPSNQNQSPESTRARAKHED